MTRSEHGVDPRSHKRTDTEIITHGDAGGIVSFRDRRT